MISGSATNFPENRFIALDSLRGFAAVAVVLGHILFCTPLAAMMTGIGRSIAPSPIHLFYAGADAVNFFFVLSGFVLAVSFGTKTPEYGRYLSRRYARIYLPYIVAVILAMIVRTLVTPASLPVSTPYFVTYWSLDATPWAFVGHFLLLPSFPNRVFDPVIWSLVQEMRASIVFPLLYRFVGRLNSRVALGLGLVVCEAAMVVKGVIAERTSIEEDYSYFPVVLVLFGVGIWLALNRERLVSSIRNLSQIQRLGLLVLGIFAFSIRYWTASATNFAATPFMVPLDAVASGIFILLALCGGNFASFLKRPLFQWLGRTSYSLYLVHMIVLSACVYGIGNSVGIYQKVAIAAALIPFATWLFYAFVELPATRLSHRIGGDK